MPIPRQRQFNDNGDILSVVRLPTAPGERSSDQQTPLLSAVCSQKICGFLR